MQQLLSVLGSLWDSVGALIGTFADRKQFIIALVTFVVASALFAWRKLWSQYIMAFFITGAVQVGLASIHGVNPAVAFIATCIVAVALLARIMGYHGKHHKIGAAILPITLGAVFVVAGVLSLLTYVPQLRNTPFSADFQQAVANGTSFLTQTNHVINKSESNK
ncbi:MAG TPA: hypothetical protein VFQ70_00140 [Candidatus Saccharimonadaceae bacterium]|nr:hypothetical protein [Candidatus Saccharimonadaceae bacterium]